MASSKFDYQFIYEPDDALRCSICLEVATGKPMQHGASGCGKLFCKKCIDKHVNKPCPMCRGKNPNYFEDVRSSRDIKALAVRCDNVTRGCTWTGTVGTLEDHVDKCGYTMVQCTQKCKKDFFFLRKELQNHMANECPNRAHQCEYCQEKDTYAKITEEHNKMCLKKPIPCLNTDCSLAIERRNLEEHVSNNCEHTIVACKYSNIGCMHTEKRKDIRKHEEDDKIHLHVALAKITQLDRAVKENSDKLEGKKSILVNVTRYTKRKEEKEILFSEPFFTVPNHYKMRVRVYVSGHGNGKGTHVSVFTELLEVPYKRQLKWPFKGTVTFELLNQLADYNHEAITVNYENNEFAKMCGGGWGCSNFIAHSRLSHNPATNTQYLVNDTLHFRVTVQEKNDRPWL